MRKGQLEIENWELGTLQGKGKNKNSQYQIIKVYPVRNFIFLMGPDPMFLLTSGISTYSLE